MNDLISIIVPVYNVEQYLKRCVDSLINQTYLNLEIVLVDDGSTDNSSHICDEYAESDNRVKVIHKSNGGLSDARNKGISIASGDYIGFVDSDDWVSTSMYEILLNTMKSENSDIVECKALWTYGSEICQNSKYQLKNYDNVQAMCELIQDKILHQHVWNKLYKREVINGLLFTVCKTNEDEFWTYQIFAKAKIISYIDQELYFYFQRNDSIMNKCYSLKRLDGLEARKERIFFLKKHYPSLVYLAKKNFLNSCMYNYQRALKYLCSSELSIAKVKIFDLYNSFKLNYIEYKQLSVKEKFWYISSNVSLTLVCKLRNCLGIGI